jgi:thiol peroxidase
VFRRSYRTGICDLQTKRFNHEADALGADVKVLTISCDLPFAQSRWCGTEGVSNVETLSDHFDLNFGLAYSLVMKELRLLARAVIVVNKQGEITYMDVNPEVRSPMDFDAALAAA